MFKTFVIAALSSAVILPVTRSRAEAPVYSLRAEMPFAGQNAQIQPVRVNTMAVSLCPGEYEPATFSIHTHHGPLQSVNVAIEDLVSADGHIISADAVDIRVVKHWYQGGETEGFGQLQIVPELLLKDDSLIEVDTQAKRNVFHFEGIPEDGPDLKPFAVSSQSHKQLWITVHAPENIEPGQYGGKITVSPANAEAREIELEVTVLPFELVDPEKNFSVYYYGPTMFQYDESKDLTLIELLDMRAHGLTSALIYAYQYETRVRQNDQGRWEVDLDPLREALELRVEAGLTAPTVFSLSSYICRDTEFRRIWTADAGMTPENEEKLTQVIEQLEKFVADHNYPQLIYYGVDEPTEARIARCERIFEVIHAAGGKTATAVYTDELDHIDAPIYALPMANRLYENPRLRTKPHEWRMHYWHPLENPSVDRFRYGILTWHAGLDGASSYAYRHVFQTDNPYQDESLGAANPKQNRNMMYTYPAKGSLVPTLQWEATREGIDDVRYLATLKYWLERSHDAQLTPQLVRASQRSRALLKDLTPAFTKTRPNATSQTRYSRDLQASDFHDLRSRVIERILELRQLLASE